MGLTITFAILWGLTAALAVKLTRENDKLTRDYQTLLHANYALEESLNDEKCNYRALRLITFAVVIRKSTVGDKTYRTLIKKFTDDDMDFNMRKAQELVDALNA